MRKILLIAAIIILSFPFAHAQRYYFFCINVGEKSDGAYIAETINSVLAKADGKDKFTIYIRGGVSPEGKIFDSEVIEDLERWNAVSSVLGYVEEYSVLPKPEMDNMLRLFQNRYSVDAVGLHPAEEINVYWFGDQEYFKAHGRDLFLKFYYACAADQTWQRCVVCPDRANGFGNMSMAQLLGTPFSQNPKLVLHSSAATGK